MFAAASFFAFVAGTAHAQNSPAIGIDENDRVVLRGNVHPALAQAKKLGHTDPQLAMQSMILVLKRSPQAQRNLDELLKAQQDPRSPLYHQWLTPEEFGEHFGPSQQQIQNITRWLTKHGFTVDEIAKGRGWINFSGNVAQVEDAFQTEIDDVEYKGERHHANTRDPSIPRALSGMVEGIRSLHDFRSRPMHRIVKVVNTTSPDFSQGGQNFMSPEDFATIYDVKPLYNAGISGAGQTIAIVGRNDIHISDVRAFRTLFGLPAKDPVIIHTNADPPNDVGEEGEAILDVTWSGAVAKNATIDFVVSSSTASSDGVDLSAQYAVNHNLAPVMSTSFGLCEAAMGAAGVTFYNNLWSQAASQGIASMVSAGDSGAAGCDDPSSPSAGGGRAVSGLCSTANNICVGGTEFNEGNAVSSFWGATDQFQGSALKYIPEKVWNESGNVSGGQGLFSGGGGPSSVNSKPFWQVAPGVPNDGARDTPDVALNAAGHDGYMICQADSQADCSKGSFGVASGTSAASPSFAGIMALVLQRTGQPQGNANVALYPLAMAQYSCSGGPQFFHDTKSGNNSVPGVVGFNAGAGYDLATGLGSVDAAVLANNWNNSATQFVVTAPAAAQAGVPFSVTVTAENGASTTIIYRGTVHFTSSDVRAGLPSDYTFTCADAGVHTFNGVFLGSVNSQTITATDTNNSNVTGQASVLVSPGPAASFNVTAPASTTAGVQFNNLMVTAADQFGNTPATYGGAVHFTSSDAQAVLPANSALTNGTGTFSATLKSAGRQFIFATDTVSSSISGSASLQVNAAAASQFSFTVPQTAQSGIAFNFRLTAKDPFGNVADGYRGTVTLTSTDGTAAFVTSPYTYTSGDAGKHIFGATLHTGSQTITATDSPNTLSKTSSTIAVGSLDPALHALPLDQIRMFRPAPPVVVAQFTDDDTSETGSNLTASIDWGDGQTDTNVPITCIQSVPNVCTVMAGHQYVTKGRFGVNVTVTDSQNPGAQINVITTLQFGPRNLSF